MCICNHVLYVFLHGVEIDVPICWQVVHLSIKLSTKNLRCFSMVKVVNCKCMLIRAVAQVYVINSCGKGRQY